MNINSLINTQSVLQNVPIWVLYALLIWELSWKGIALWKSAKNNHPYWFICILIINTIGILPIVYIAFFSKKSNKNK